MYVPVRTSLPFTSVRVPAELRGVEEVSELRTVGTLCKLRVELDDSFLV